MDWPEAVEMLVEQWDRLDPAGRAQLLGIKVASLPLVVFRPWAELDGKERERILSWIIGRKNG